MLGLYYCVPSLDPSPPPLRTPPAPTPTGGGTPPPQTHPPPGGGRGPPPQTIPGQVGGQTSISDGFSLGHSVLLGAGSRSTGIRNVVLLSDGSQTTDGDDITAIAAAALLKGDGVNVFAIGFGAATISTINRWASHY